MYYLVIKRPGLADAGTYQCRAETEVSVVTTECTIMVNGEKNNICDDGCYDANDEGENEGGDHNDEKVEEDEEEMMIMMVMVRIVVMMIMMMRVVVMMMD